MNAPHLSCYPPKRKTERPQRFIESTRTVACNAQLCMWSESRHVARTFFLGGCRRSIGEAFCSVYPKICKIEWAPKAPRKISSISCPWCRGWISPSLVRPNEHGNLTAVMTNDCESMDGPNKLRTRKTSLKTRTSKILKNEDLQNILRMFPQYLSWKTLNSSTHYWGSSIFTLKSQQGGESRNFDLEQWGKEHWNWILKASQLKITQTILNVSFHDTYLEQTENSQKGSWKKWTGFSPVLHQEGSKSKDPWS